MKHEGSFFELFSKSSLLFLLIAGLASCSGGEGPPTPEEPCTPEPSSPAVANVLNYGATGNGSTDDTAAIQTAVNAVAGTGGTVLIPAGIYMVDAERSISLGSQMTLRLGPGAILRAIPNSATNYAVLQARSVSHVNVVGGGAIEGELGAHTGSGGEWGHCLSINRSSHIVVEDVTAREAWGDGFYVSDGTDVTFCNVRADHNRRQGMSIVGGDHVVVRDSVFTNTVGFFQSDGDFVCGTGIDIEPNEGQTVNDVLITGCVFTGNAGGGIASGPAISNTGKAFTTNIVIDGNTVSGNGTNAHPHPGIEISNTKSHRIVNNTVSGNTSTGIYLRNNADENEVSGNVVTGSIAVLGRLGNGILLYLTGGNTVINNIVTGNDGCGIRDVSPKAGGNDIRDNTVSGNGPCP